MSIRRIRGKDGLSDSYSSFASYDSEVQSTVMNDFSGGVLTDGVSDGENKVFEMLNMEIVGKSVVSMSAPADAFSEALAQGPVHFSCMANGVWLFRKGNTLYAQKDGNLSVIGTSGLFTSEKTAIYDTGDEFYIIDGDTVYRLDRTLALSQPEQYIPTCYTEVSADGKNKTEVEKPNLFCPYIEISLSAESSPTRKIPPDIAVDSSYIRIWDSFGEELADMDFNFEEGEIKFFGIYSQEFKVRLKLIESDDPVKLSLTSLESLREIISCPGRLQIVTMPSGNRYYLSYGREDGKKLTAFLPDSFHGFGYLSEKNIVQKEYYETVSSVIEYSDGYLVFSAGSVKKLALSEDENGGLLFTIRLFKNDFGSDMPGSICSFDDKILFATSHGGVYYINKFGIEERDVSRHISACIERGKNGFFSHTATEYAAATAICAFGKYMLTVGNMSYIWDYTAKMPSGTQSREDENKMVWTMCDSILPSCYLGQQMQKLYFTDRTTENIRCFTAGAEGSGTMHSCIQTIEDDFGVEEDKLILGLSVRYRSLGEVTLKIAFDGVISPCCYILPPAEQFVTCPMRIFSHRFVKCAVLLDSEQVFALESILFRYLPTKS